MRVFLTFVFAFVCATSFAQDPPSVPIENHERALLADSPRHHEWVRLKQGDREVHAFVVYPEVDHKAKSVVVIHENRGLNDWVRTVADRLASEGYIAIAPDLLSGMGPGGGRTSDFPDSDAAREGIYALDPDQVTADLTAVTDYVRNLPAANGEVAVAGFCWGGGQSFRFATNYDSLRAAYVFYGRPPSEGLDRLNAPVYGFYAGNDERINATLPDAAHAIRVAGGYYRSIIYRGAGHGFMRRGEGSDASEADSTAMKQAWERWLNLLGLEPK